MTGFTQRNSLLIMHLIVIILGFTGILGKLIESSTSIIVWYRMLIAFLSLGIFLFFKQKLIDSFKQNLFALLGIGAIVALHWVFFFESIKVSNVSIAVVCLATSSLFSALIEPFIFKRKIKIYELIFGLIVILALGFALQTDTTKFLGYLYGVIAAFLATIFTILNALYINKTNSTTITFVEMIGGFLLITTYLIFFSDIKPEDFQISFNDIIFLMILGVVCTSFAFAVSVEVMKTLSPYSVIMTINLEPIYSIIIALFLFGESEKMTVDFYIGASVVILIVFLDGYIKNKLKKTN